jgi:hypothetical protein
MALYIRSMKVWQDRESIVGSSYELTRTRSSGMFGIKVEFTGDEEGAYELQKLGSDGLTCVSVIPGATGYAQQCQKYEAKIAELEKKFEEVTRSLVKATREVENLRGKSIQVGVARNGANVGDIVSIDLSTGYLLSSGKVMVQARSPAGTGDVQFPAQGVVVRRMDGQFLRVDVGDVEGWEVVAEGLDGPIYEGDEVTVSRLMNGAIVARKSASTGKKPVKIGEKPAPARFNVLELDEDE